MTQAQIVVERLRKPRFFKYSFTPNVPIIIEAAYRHQVDDLWCNESVDDVIQACVEGFEIGDARFGGNYGCRPLAENPKIKAVLDAVYQHYRPRFASNVGNDQIILGAALDKALNPDEKFDAGTLIDLVALPQIWKQLRPSSEFQAQVAANNERQRMIDALIEGGKPFIVDGRSYDSKGFEIQWSSSGGRARVKGDEGFPGWTDEQVKYAYDVVMRVRRLKGMDTKDLRKYAHAEGVKRFEERFHVNPESNTPTKATAKQLIDPRNGQPFTTKSQLVSFLNSFPRSEGVRRLTMRNGQIDPDLGAQFYALMSS